MLDIPVLLRLASRVPQHLKFATLFLREPLCFACAVKRLRILPLFFTVITVNTREYSNIIISVHVAFPWFVAAGIQPLMFIT
jgi:hypothetical protein